MSEEEKIYSQLSAYLDNELSDAERQAVERALTTDAELAREFQRLQTVRKMVGELPVAHADEGFVAGVMHRIERQNLTSSTAETQPPTTVRRFRWLASAAILLIAVGIGAVITVVLQAPTFSDRVAQTPPVEPIERMARRVDKDEAEGQPRLSKAIRAEDFYYPLDEAPQPVNAETLPEVTPDRRILAKGADRPDVEMAGKVDEEGPTAERVFFDSAQREESQDTIAETYAKASSPARGSGAGGEVATETQQRDELLAAAPGSQPFVADTSGWRELADARNEEIFTDDLPATQRQVEQILLNNRIVPLVFGAPTGTNRDRIRQQHLSRAANYTQLSPEAPNQVQFLAYVTPEQMTNIRNDLDQVRRRQNVVQTRRTPRRAKILGKAPCAEIPSGMPMPSGQTFGDAKDIAEVKQRAGAPVSQPGAQAYVAIEQTQTGLRLKGGLTAEQQTSEQRLGQVPQTAPPLVEGPSPTLQEAPQQAERQRGQFAGGMPVDQLQGANVQPLLITLNVLHDRATSAKTIPSMPPMTQPVPSQQPADR